MVEKDDIATRWHRKVEGRWFGAPSHYDARGVHSGYSQPRRTVVRDPAEAQAEGLGQPTADSVLIDVPADQFLHGALQQRIEVGVQSAWVTQTERSRIYEGPDFFGAGYPYGSLTLGWVHFCPWKCDAKVIVQILPDQVSQVYDNVQYIGESVGTCLNGQYLLASDHDDNAETRARVEAFLDAEKAAGKTLFRHSTRREGQWSGQLQAYDERQEFMGDVEVQIDYSPLDHHRARFAVQLSGPVKLNATYTRYRHDNEFYYEGPDAYGNAVAYGRSLYLRQQLRGTGLRLVGREFLLDDAYNMAIVWELKHGHHLKHVLHGKLAWQSDGQGMDNR